MEAAPATTALRAGPIEVRPGESLALAAGRVLNLSVREYGLLVALAGRAERIVSREDLYAAVWDAELRPGDRSVDVYVHKLRVKLETSLPGWRCIHTHVGFGYRLSPEQAEASHPFHNGATGS
jgi:DNA-binding response OmpR family regulator